MLSNAGTMGGLPWCQCSPPDGRDEGAPVGDHDGAGDGAAAGGEELRNVGGGEPAGNGFPTGCPDRSDPKTFCQDLFPRGALASLVEIAVKADFRPEVADNPEDMIPGLLPSDSHLD